MEEPISIRFRKRLRELRLACHWTQERTAEACGIGYKLYQLYEIGLKQNPGLLTLDKLAAGFGLKVHEFLAPTIPRTKMVKGSPAQQSKRRKPVKRMRRGRKHHL